MRIINYASASSRISRQTFSLHTFTNVQKIFSRKNFNVRIPLSIPYHAIFVQTGKAISHFISDSKKNKKIILHASAILLSFVLLFHFFSYNVNHTGPLEFSKLSIGEVDAVTELMKNFPGQNDATWNENGELAGSEKKVSTVFKTAVTWKTYLVQNGDTLGSLTKKFHLTNLSTLISANNISSARSLRQGQKISVPSIDGIVYTVSKGNSLSSIAKKFGITIEDLADVNDLSSETISVGTKLFIPGGTIDSGILHSVLGDFFKNPIHARYRISSGYGYRPDPFTGVRSFHTGVDFACPRGTAVFAASDGKVAFTGWSNVFGNYVILTHASGYQTLYGHLSEIAVKKSERVSTSYVIGRVGSTGYSTGDHLHFTVYKNGSLINPMTVLK